jgi:uncharacterized protein YcgI (DUF1989 family)
MQTERIPEKRGISFRVDAGEQFEVTDPNGKQVADLVAFDADDHTERFSPKYTYRRENELRPTTGDRLYTTEGEAILRFVEDDCGIHDLLYAPCNHWVVGDYYGQSGEYSCRKNLTEVLEGTGITQRDLQETLNIFMKSEIEDYEVEIAEPESEPGDTVVFEAETDAIVAISACSGESTVNADSTKPIDVTLSEGSIIDRNY